MFSNSPTICTAKLPDAFFYDPQGSIMDPTRPPSPTDLRDFPELTLAPPHVPPAPPVGNYLLDQVVPVQCTIRTVRIMENDNIRYRILSICSGGDQSFEPMIDGGANVGMAPNENNLVDVRTILPVKVGLALSLEGDESESFCTQMGYLPMTRTAGCSTVNPCSLTVSPRT